MAIPHVASKVLLYYKAKSPRQKDEIDLTAILPVVDSQQRSWLRNAISTSYGRESPGCGRSSRERAYRGFRLAAE
jgi:hypothetical protein